MKLKHDDSTKDLFETVNKPLTETSLRRVLAYAQMRLPSAKPLWHWSEIFKRVWPGGPLGMDIDRASLYRGHFLICEARRQGTQFAAHQIEVLEALAAEANKSVLVLELRAVWPDKWEMEWWPIAWTWVGNPRWRDHSTWAVGGPAEFEELLLEWKRRIDALVTPAANEEWTREPFQDDWPDAA